MQRCRQQAGVRRAGGSISGGRVGALVGRRSDWSLVWLRGHPTRHAARALRTRLSPECLLPALWEARLPRYPRAPRRRARRAPGGWATRTVPPLRASRRAVDPVGPIAWGWAAPRRRFSAPSVWGGGWNRWRAHSAAPAARDPPGRNLIAAARRCAVATVVAAPTGGANSVAQVLGIYFRAIIKSSRSKTVFVHARDSTNSASHPRRYHDCRCGCGRKRRKLLTSRWRRCRWSYSLCCRPRTSRSVSSPWRLPAR